jgi:hypothetical protein
MRDKKSYVASLAIAMLGLAIATGCGLSSVTGPEPDPWVISSQGGLLCALDAAWWWPHQWPTVQDQPMPHVRADGTCPPGYLPPPNYRYRRPR